MLDRIFGADEECHFPLRALAWDEDDDEWDDDMDWEEDDEEEEDLEEEEEEWDEDDEWDEGDLEDEDDDFFKRKKAGRLGWN